MFGERNMFCLTCRIANTGGDQEMKGLKIAKSKLSFKRLHNFILKINSARGKPKENNRLRNTWTGNQI